MILYISDTDLSRRAVKTAFIYLIIALLCGVFGAVYELFSHEVYSFYMIYAFAVPLVGGTFLFSVLSLFRIKWYPCTFVRNLYHSGIAALTVGSVIRGILDIYGTTNRLIMVYWYVGRGFIIMAIMFCLFMKLRK